MKTTRPSGDEGVPRSSLIDILLFRATDAPDQVAYTFLSGMNPADVDITYATLDERCRAVAAHLQRSGWAGRPALLLYPSGLEFVIAFLGCLCAGVVAVPAYPPRPGRRLGRLQAIVAHSDAGVVLTTQSVLSGLQPSLAADALLGSLPVVTTDAVPSDEARLWTHPHLSGDTLAYLQYTSGSTGAPKGVMITHDNLLCNSEVVRRILGLSPSDVSVTWLPTFHDFGLVAGVLQPLYTGFRGLLMPPEEFVMQPSSWLRAMSDHRGTVSWSPNFGYELCLARIDDSEKAGLDLSPWQVACCGAETVRRDTLERFARFFAPCGFRPEALVPGYGLAENTLAVSGSVISRGMIHKTLVRSDLEEHRLVEAGERETSTLDLVSCGPPGPGVDVRIVDPESRVACPPDRIGEIWLGGPSVAAGYSKRPEDTEETFRARLAPSGEGPFLRTGDLGFLADGELYIAGRIKDLIIIRGRNIYPQDVEWTVEQVHPALRPGCSAAFPVEIKGEERLVVVGEVDDDLPAEADGILAEIRRRVVEEFDVEPQAVVFVRPVTIPKTSSGKIQRRATATAFLSGTLQVVASWTAPPAEAPSEAAAIPGQPDLSGTGSAAGDQPGQGAAGLAGVRQPGSGEIAAWLLSRVAAISRRARESIDPSQPFSRYGLDSPKLVGLTGDLGLWLGRTLPVTLFWDYPSVTAVSRHLAQDGPADDRSAEGRLETHREPIAIVGMGCRFPGASGPAGFWRLLRDGVDAIGEVPPDRWDADAFYDEDRSAPGKMNTRWGGFLESIDRFDAGFFGINPREASRMDPQQRLLLEVTWEALEDAGLPPSTLAGTRTGVFAGISTFDYATLGLRDPELIDGYTGTGLGHSIAANRVSYFFDFHGPSVAVDTACSASLVAAHLACHSLRDGESDLALAGGVNVILTPDTAINFTKTGATSPDGRCRSFDARANGYVRGEGAGVVVLRPLSQALARGDRIYAVILGSAVNQDGRTNGLMAPNGLAQEAVLREAYRRAGVSPGQVQYVEAHGTGTPLGDPIEARALGAVLGIDRPPDSPCRLGSVKSNFGHLEAGAGVAGLVKTALAIYNRHIPASLHYESPNPHIPFDSLPLVVQRTASPWPPGRALAGVSSFGFGGTNCHVVLAEVPDGVVESTTPSASTGPTAPPALAGPTAPPALAGSAAPPAPEVSSGVAQSPELLALSAATPDALTDLVKAYRDFVAQDGAPSLRDIAFTAAARRDHHEHRLAVAVRDRDHLSSQLDSLLRGESPPGSAAGRVPPTGPPKVVFVFPGQGAQWWAMGRQLAAEEPVFQDSLRRCDTLLREHTSWSLLDELGADEANSRLGQTEVNQPALVSIQVALVELWRSWGVVPDAVIGHSMGEVSAAHVAGALSLEQTMWVASQRGRVMKAAEGLGLMLVANLSPEEAGDLAAASPGRVYVAAVNGPASVVLSGEAAAIEETAAKLQAAGVFCRGLRTHNIPGHCPYMDEVTKDLADVLSGLTPTPVAMPMFLTTTGEEAGDTRLDSAYWRRNLRQPVLFGPAVRRAVEGDYTVFVEMSPHPTLGPAVEDTLRQVGRPGVALGSLRREENERWSMLSSLAVLYTLGLPIAWSAVFPGGRCVSLPTYPWRRDSYWLDDGGEAGRADASGDDRRTLRRGEAHYSGSRRGAGRAPFSSGKVHASLGARVSLAPGAGEIVWESEARISRPPLGRALGPDGAVGLGVFLEMVLTAAAEIWGPGGTTLTNVVAGQSLVLRDEAPRRVQLALSALGERETDFAVLSCPVSGEPGPEPWTRHVTGRVGTMRVPPGQEAAAGAIAGIQGRCEAQAGLWRRDGEVLAEVSGDLAAAGPANGAPPVSRAATAPNAALFPLDLEAVVSRLLPLARPGGPPVSAWQVTAVERMEVLDGTGPGRWWHLLAGEAGGPVGASGATLRLLDEEGRPALEMDGLRLAPGGRVPPVGPAGFGDWLYELRWRPEPVATPAPEREPARGHAGSAAGLWLVLAGEKGTDGQRDLGEDLVAFLRARGDRCVLARPGAAGEGPSRTGPDEWRLDPEAPDQYRHLIANTLAATGGGGATGSGDATGGGATGSGDATGGGGARGGGGATEAATAGIVYLWGLDPAGRSPDLATLERADILGCRALVHLVQAILAQPDLTPPRLYLVTQGVHAVIPGDAITGLSQSPLWGLGGTLALEHPELSCVRVDLDPARPPDAAALGAELLSRDAEDQIALRGEERFVARLARAVLANDPSAPAPSPGEVIIDVYASGPLGGLAGRVVAVGAGVADLGPDDEVMAVAAGDPVSRVGVPAALVAARPDSLTPVQAAAVWGTLVLSSFGLDALANLTPGETVTIHPADRSVGLAAAQVARRAGGRVVMATVDPAAPSSTTIVLPDQGGRVISLDGGGPASGPPLAFPPVAEGFSYFALSPAVLAAQRPDRLRPVVRGLLSDLAAGLLGPAGAETLSSPTAAPKASSDTLPVRRMAGPAGVRPDGAYLVTGGLTGVGLRLARWLAGSGAGHLALMGRRPPSAEAERSLAEMRASGVDVGTFQADAADPDQVRAVLDKMDASMPTLRGVFHAAGTVDGNPLRHLTPRQLAVVLRPKVRGAWVLHELTRDRALDVFVLFSSASSIIGLHGHANYAAGNAFLDALARYRRSLGLPATSVNWGAWAEVGMVANQSVHGLEHMAPEDGLAILDRLARSGREPLAVVRADWSLLAEAYPLGAQTPLFAELAPEWSVAPRGGPVSTSMAARLAALDTAGRRALLQERLKELLAGVLRLPAARLNSEEPFHLLGLDSLIAVEFKSRVHAEFGYNVRLGRLLQGATIAQLAGEMAESPELGGGGPAFEGTEPTGVGRRAQAEGLLANIESMSDAEVEAALARLVAEGKSPS